MSEDLSIQGALALVLALSLIFGLLGVAVAWWRAAETSRRRPHDD